MNTLMIKSLTSLLALMLCLSTMAQDQQPDDSQNDQTQENPTPAELLRQLLQQNGDTNGTAQEALAELLRAAQEGRQANGENQPEDGNAKPDEPGTARPIRGQGTRGTTGTGTNTQALAALIQNDPTNGSPNGSKTLRLNFRNAPLSLVLNYLSDAAGFTISANSKVDLRGAVTVWSNQMVDRNEAIAILNSALTSSGYGATVEGNLLNIYVVDATTTPIETGIPGEDYRNIPATKDLVTQIVYVNSVEANQLISSLQPLMPSGTSMSANQGANAIIITDTKANIRRMAQLVKALDTASVSASSMAVFPLMYADATALAQVVTQLFQTDSNQGRNRGGGFPGFPGFGGGDRGRGDNNSSSTQAGRMTPARVTAVADERSNSLVVSASDAQLEAVTNLVRQMDVDVDDLTELRVFRLRYADPQETADQLTSLFPDSTTQQNSRNQQFGFRGFFGGGGGDNNRGRNNTSQESRTAKQSRVTAVPDPRTGSVIVSASQQLMGQIASIIDDLDSDPSKKKKVYVISVENRDPQEVVQELQSVISADSSANVNSRNNANQSGSQLNTRQQNTLQNQGNNNNTISGGFGTGGGTRNNR